LASRGSTEASDPAVAHRVAIVESSLLENDSPIPDELSGDPDKELPAGCDQPLDAIRSAHHGAARRIQQR